MKRLLSTLLALVLLLGVCSCSGTSGPPSGAPDASDPSQQTDPAPADAEPASPDTAPPDQPDPQDLDDLPKVPPFDLEKYAVADAPGVYDLSLIPEVGGMPFCAAALTRTDQVVLMAGTRNDQLWTLDLETGECVQLATLPLPQDQEWSSVTILSTDPLLIYEYTQSALYLVQDDGSVTTLTQGNGDVVGSWNYAVSRDAYYFYQMDTGCLLRLPLDGGETETVFQAPLDYFYIQLHGLTPDKTEAVLSASAADGTEILMTVSLSTGEISHLYCAPLDEFDSVLPHGVTGKILVNANVDEDTPTLVHLTCSHPGEQVSVQIDLDALQPIEFSPPETDGTGTQAPDSPASDSFDPGAPEDSDPVPDWYDGGDGEGWYDGGDGEEWFDGDFGGDPLGPWVDTYFSPNTFWGQSLICAYSQSDSHLLLWDYRELAPQPVQVQPLTAYEPPAGGAQEIFAQRAKKLEDTYGISIHMGEDIAAPFPDYTLSECQDMESTKHMMDVLEEALALYPEDYFTQLGGSSVRGFSFYFSGEMTPLDPSVSISAPAGLTCQVDGVELIAFDISGYIQVQDVVHELTHVLDHWLWENNVLDEDVWDRMNPDGFTYYYAYVDPDGVGYDVSGSSEYTSWGDAYYDGDVESVYFVDPYSTTYPTEDRARLMEYLLANGDYGPPDYYSSTHVQAKLTYYFQCIREKFDTANWPEQTSWEAALAKVAGEG